MSKTTTHTVQEITELKLPWGTIKIGPGTVSSFGKTDMDAIIKTAKEEEGIWDTDKDGYYGGPTSSSSS